MDIRLFYQMLSIDSTSGREMELADFLAEALVTGYNRVERYDVGDGTCNLLFSWGEPKIVFCTHLDTVPPYIPPVNGVSNARQCRATHVSEIFEENGSSDGTRQALPDGMPLGAVSCADWGLENDSTSTVYGRGTCDAKGQIFAMWEACKALEAKGYSDFGLLLLSGEETGSYGAKAFRNQHPGADLVVVGEPTDNHMVSASKGTKAFEIEFRGKAFHSGYPEYGISAIELFNDFMNALRSIRFPYDEVLGDTTWNIGRLTSDNPQNILSDSLSCRLYFRTTFESDEMVCNVMKNICGPQAKLRFGRPRVQDGSDIVAKEVAQWQNMMTVKALGGDSPMSYTTLAGFPVKPVSFGSDAPQLTNFRRRMICGPGSILVAHRDEECISMSDIECAVANYIRIYEYIKDENI